MCTTKCDEVVYQCVQQRKDVYLNGYSERVFFVVNLVNSNAYKSSK